MTRTILDWLESAGILALMFAVVIYIDWFWKTLMTGLQNWRRPKK